MGQRSDKFLLLELEKTHSANSLESLLQAAMSMHFLSNKTLRWRTLPSWVNAAPNSNCHYVDRSTSKRMNHDWLLHIPSSHGGIYALLTDKTLRSRTLSSLKKADPNKNCHAVDRSTPKRSKKTGYCTFKPWESLHSPHANREKRQRYEKFLFWYLEKSQNKTPQRFSLFYREMHVRTLCRRIPYVGRTLFLHWGPPPTNTVARLTDRRKKDEPWPFTVLWVHMSTYKP